MSLNSNLIDTSYDNVYIDALASNPVIIPFKLSGLCYNTCPKIIIKPTDNSYVKIKITTTAYDTEITTNKETSIKQISLNEYPKFGLFINSIEMHNKSGSYEGLVQIDGYCEIIKEKEYYYDH